MREGTLILIDERREGASYDHPSADQLIQKLYVSVNSPVM